MKYKTIILLAIFFISANHLTCNAQYLYLSFYQLKTIVQSTNYSNIETYLSTKGYTYQSNDTKYTSGSIIHKWKDSKSRIIKVSFAKGETEPYKVEYFLYDSGTFSSFQNAIEQDGYYKNDDSKTNYDWPVVYDYEHKTSKLYPIRLAKYKDGENIAISIEKYAYLFQD